MMKRTEHSQQQAFQHSQQQAEEHSQQQARQEQSYSRQDKPKGYDRDTAKYEANEEKHSTEESYSQPVPKHLRTGADVQEGNGS